MRLSAADARTFLVRAAKVTRPSTMRSLAREVRWRERGDLRPQLPPTWELDRGLLASTEVIWPARYMWPPQASWVEPIRIGISSLVPVRRGDLDESMLVFPGVVPFLLTVGDRRLAVAIDYGDDTALDASLLSRFDLVFKMQHLLGGYGSDRVVPGGFVPNALSLYRYLPHVRKLRDRTDSVFDAFGRFGADKTIEVRREAVRQLTEQKLFRYKGGIGRVRYAESLAEAARAQVCIDLPGLGPFCFRLVDYLAIGTAIVSPPHACQLHVPLEPERHVIFCKPDVSDLVETVAELLRNPGRVARLREETRVYFDRFLDYRQLSRYYLACCFERL